MERIELTSDGLYDLCQDFKALSDESRLKIIIYLLGGRQTVNAISEKVGLSQSATSHQLRILKDAKILKCERLGNANYYYLSDEHVKTLILTAIEHLGC